MNTMKRAAARVIGNFGISFVGPLIAGNFVQSIYQGVVTIEQTLVMALLSSTLVTGLVLFQEIQAFGYYGRTSGKQ